MIIKPFLFQTKTGGHHSEPMVAMVCPEKGEPGAKLFHNKFLSSDGKWQTDTDYKATCKKDKVEVLEYCKKVINILFIIYN